MDNNEFLAQNDFDLLKVEFKEIKGDDNSDETYQKLLIHFNGEEEKANNLFYFDYKRLTANIVKRNGIIELSDDVYFYTHNGSNFEQFFLQRIA